MVMRCPAVASEKLVSNIELWKKCSKVILFLECKKLKVLICMADINNEIHSVKLISVISNMKLNVI